VAYRRRVQLRGGLTALVLLAALASLAGCGGGDDSGGTPQAEVPSGSTVPSGGTTDVPPDGSPGTAPPDDVERLLRSALEPLLGEPVIDFRHDVYSGTALAIETKGRAFQHVGWQSTTTSPKQLDSPQPPQGDAIKGSMRVRDVGEDLYLQLSTWGPPLASCWLRAGSGQVPGGLLAMTPGVPGYVTLLGALQPAQVVGQDGGKAVIAAEVPLRIGLQLLTTGALGLLQLQAGQLDGASVPVGVRLTDGVLTDVELRGTDLVSAVRAAGGDVSADAEVTLGQLRVRVSYKPAPGAAPRVTAPAGGLVMTNADVKANRGC